MRDVGLELRQEFETATEAAEAEFTPVADPVTASLVQKYNVADAKIAELRQKYADLSITGVEDRKGYDMVHAARMDVRDLRLQVEKTRKMLKEDSLEYGRKVDREAKRITSELAPIEDALAAKEAVIDAERERIKAEKQHEADARLQARIDALQKVGAPFQISELVQMTDAAFDFRLATATDDWKVKEAARIEAEAALAKVKAEQEAKEKADREAKEAAEKADREAMEKTRREQVAEAARLAEARAELERQAAKLKAQQDAQEQAAREERARQEGAARAKAEAERIAAEESARREREAREAAERAKAAEAAKPDAEKIRALAKVIREIALPKLSTDAGRAVMTEIDTSIGKFVAFIEGKANALAPITNPKAP